jgi:hypothetical protein
MKIKVKIAAYNGIKWKDLQVKEDNMNYKCKEVQIFHIVWIKKGWVP